MMNTPYIESQLLQPIKSCVHGFFTRVGGVSTGIFDSLNCGLFSEDNPDDVETNRNRILSSLGGKKLISLKQVHSNHVHFVDKDWDEFSIIEGDGLVTSTHGILLGMLGADCPAVLFYDSKNRVAGAAHCGWKGAISGVTDSVINLMCESGATIGTIVASIGPGIQQYSYEVSKEFQYHLTHSSGMDCADCFINGNSSHKLLFNLPEYIDKKLRIRGLENIDRLSADTYSDELQFFSYRRACHRSESLYGRQISVIGMRDDNS